MKILIYLFLTAFFASTINAQHITNKLGVGGNFIVTDISAVQKYFYVNSLTGSVGIGSSSFDSENPERLLINCGVTNSVNALYIKGTIDDYFQFNIRNLSNGTQASSDIVATADNGTETSNYVNLGINSSGYVWQSGNQIEFGRPNDCYLLANGNDLYIANSNGSKDVVFLTGGTSTGNERFRIKHNGRIGIGVSNPTNLLSLSGGAFSNGSTWSNSSDSTLKRNIETLSKYGLAEIMKMRSVSYYYKADNTNKPEIGFIAQELKNIVPEVVSGGEGSMGVSYGNLIPVLVNAIKEQQAMIDKQQKEIDANNTDIKNMKSDIEGLKTLQGASSAGFGLGQFNVGNIFTMLLLAGLVYAFCKYLRKRA